MVAAAVRRLRRPTASIAVLTLVSFSLQVVSAPAASAVPGCTPTGIYNNCRLFYAYSDNLTFTVPKGVTSLGANLSAAGGGRSTYDGANGGAGGSAAGTIAVTPGQVLNVTAGQAAGYGGGGLGGGGGTRGTGGRGGGMSALWTGAPFTGTPLLIAGGGGGASGAGGPNPAGGVGGGATGGSGRSTHSVAEGGGGATQTAGGAGAPAFTGGTVDAGTNGTQFQGGNGGDGQDSGGGGGGGWYGGGGGHGQRTTGDMFNSDGGGGGGSGYVGGPGVTNGSTTAGAGATAGNDGQVLLQWYAPAPTISSPAPESTVVDLTPTVTGTGVPGASLSLKFNGTTVVCAEGAPVVVTVGGGWTCTPTQDQPTGTTTVIATQSDPAQPAAVYPPSASDMFTIAAPPPPAPAITGPTEGAYLSSNTPTISGTGKPGAVVTVKNAGGVSLCASPPTVNSSGNWSCVVGTAIPDGPASFIPTQTNSGGTSVAGTTVHVTIDTAAPAAPTINALPARTSNNKPTLSGTGEPFATMNIRYGDDISPCQPAPVVASNGTWSCTPQTALPDGPVTFTPKQTDRAGNISVAGTPTSTIIDTVAPAAPVITAPAEGSHLSDSTPDVSGTGEVGATVTVKDLNGNTVCTPKPVVGSDGNWSCTVGTALPDGANSFTPTQTDQTGNVSVAGATVHVVIDTVVAAPVITGPTEGSYLSDNTPTISGTGEAGATVTVKDDDGNTVCTAVVGLDGKWNCTLTTSLPDGPASFTPTQVDLAGNVSVAGTTVHVIIDTAAPDAPVLTGPTDGSYVVTGTPELSGTGEVGAKVTVVDKDGNVVCTPLPVVGDDGTWKCTVSTALPEGANSFTPKQTDRAGNVSEAGTTVNVLVDTVADPPVITGPTEGAYLSDNTPTITGTGEPGATVRVLDKDGNSVCTPLPVVQEDGTWSCPVALALADGTNSFTPTQTDVAGNVSDAGTTVNVVVDTAVAAPVITGPTEGSYLASNTPLINGTGEAGATVTVLDVDGNSVCSPLPVVKEDGTWSCTVAAALPEGANSFTATQTDLAGNISVPGTTVNVIIDTQAPDAPVITGPTEGAYLSSNTPSITGTGEPGATVTVIDIDGNSICSPLPVVQEDGTWTCSVAAALPEGANSFTPTQKDLAGNVSDAGTTVHVVIDTVVDAPVITAPAKDAYLSDNTPDLTGTGEPGATVTVLDKDGNVVCTPSPVVQQDGTWSCTVATALADGPNSFTPTQKDLAGNVSDAGTTVNVTVDTAAPDAPVITGPAKDAYLSDNTPDLTGTGEPGATVTVLDKDGNVVCTPSPVVQQDGTWSCTVATALADGPNSFTPTQKDLAGNVSDAGTTVNVTVDTAAPDAPVITGPAKDAYLSDNTPDLTGTGEPGATVTVLDKDGNVVCTPSPVVQQDGTWSCTVATALADGPNSFTPTQKDLAGNVSDAGTTVKVTIDTVVDAPVITGPTEGAHLSDSTPTISGTGEAGATVTVVDENGSSVCSPLPVVQGDGSWTCTLATALADGSHSLTPTQTDLAGNVSAAGTTVTVVVDTVVDAPVITGPTQGAYLKDNTPDLSGTGEPGASVTIFDSTGNIVCTPLPVVGNDGKWTCTAATALVEGANSFTPIQTDLAGNVSAAGTTVAVVIDTVVDAPVITGPTQGAHLKDNTPELSGTGEVGASVTVVDKDGNVVCSPPPVVQEDGKWICAVATALPEGANSFTATQTDLAGNVSAAGTTVDVVIDTLVDAPVITGPAEGAHLPSNTPTISGTGEVGATVTVLDKDGNSVCSPAPVVQGDGTWSCAVASALADGANSFTPTQTDLAGNVSAAGTTINVIIDTVVDVPVITGPTDGAYLSDNTPDLTGTGEVGATVTVTDKDGNSVCTPLPVVQGDGTWSCTVSTALADGANSFTPTQQDLAGNVSAAGTKVDVVVDTVVDVPVITGPTAGAYLKDNTPDLSGTGEPGATVTVLDKDGNSVCTPLPVVQGNGTWSCTVATGLADGANSFTPTQTDLAGNVSAAGATVDVIIDTVVDVPVITGPVAGAYLKDNTPDLSGTGEPGATVTVLDKDGNSVCTPSPVVQGDGTWSCTVATALADGKNSFTPTQTDLAGNVSAAGTTVDVVVDTVVDAPVITGPAEGAYLKDNTPDLSGTGEVGATVTVLDKDGNSVCTPLPVVQGDGTWSCTVAFALADGKNSFTPTQTDLAGNVSAAGTTVDVVVDTVVDAPVITGPVAGAYLKDNTPDLSGTGEVGATVTVLDKDGNSVCTPLPVVQGDGTWSCTVATALADGKNSFTPTQTDLAGNVSAAGTTVDVVVDTVVDAPVITGPAEGAYLKDNTPDLSGTGEPGATVTVLDKDGNSVCSPLPVVGSAGTWSCTVVTALADGANSFTPTQTDLAGNISVAGTTVNVTVDTEAPGAPAITGPTEGAYLSDNTPALSGTGEVGATVTVKDPSGNVVCVPSPVVDVDGKWKCVVATVLPDGPHSFTPTQTDVAGNVSVAGTTINFMVDTVVAAPVITGPLEGDQLADTTPDLSGTGEPGATVTVTDKDGNTVCSPLPVVGGNGKWTCTVGTALPEGPNSFTPTQTDLAGNVSAAGVKVHVTIDSEAPAAPAITEPAEGSYLSDNTPELSGTGEPGASVTVLDKDGIIVCDPLPVVGLDGKWSCTLATVLADGPNSFTPTQADAAGNVSVAGTTVHVTVDTVVDAPVITGPTQGSYLSDNTPDLSGTGEPGAKVTVKDSSGTIVCTPLPVVGSDGKWTCTVATALPDGATSFTAVQTDLAGNVSAAGTTVDVVIDTVVAPPVITGPTEGAQLSDNTPTLAGTGEAGASVTVVDRDGKVVCSPRPVVGEDGKWSCTVATALPDGANSFTPTQTDLAGNISAAGATVNVTVDTAAPDVPVITGPAEGAHLSDNRAHLSGTGEKGAAVTVVDENGNVVCTPLPVVGGDGTWTCTAVQALPDGPHSFTPTQTDLAGNVSAAGVTVHVIVDTEVAAPVITGPVDGAHLRDRTPTLTGTGEVGATVTVKDSAGNSVCTPLPVVGSNGKWTCTVTTALPDGPHSFTATQTDLAGNVSAAGRTVAVVIDTAAPAAPTINPLPSRTTDHLVVLSGRGEPGATIVITDEAGRLVCTKPAVVASDGTWTCIPNGPLPDGPYLFTATQTDAAGNVSSASRSATTVIDTVAPPAPEVTGPQDGTVIDNGTPNPPITGIRGAAGDTITVKSAGKTICTTTVRLDGSWTCLPATPFKVGMQFLSITETDAVGNVSAPTLLMLDKRPVTDLAVTSTSAGDITVGQNTTIVVTVSNEGLDSETMAKVTDPIAGAIGFVSYTATAGSYDPGTGIWTVGKLGAGDRQTLTLTVTGRSVGSATVPFKASGSVTDVDGSNDTSVVTIKVAAAPVSGGGVVTTVNGGAVVTTVVSGVVTTTVVNGGVTGGGMAYTGYNAAAWVGIGSLLLLGGMLVIIASRRRRAVGGQHLG